VMPMDDSMISPKPALLLISGIPGTGKTYYGDKFASAFGFVHHDVEDPATAQRLSIDPAAFIEELTRLGRNTVVTWGFHPEDSLSVDIVRLFRNSGFKLIWFDGNRRAALSAFLKRGTVPEEAFVAQVQRIETTKIVEMLKPIIINPFNEAGQFKSAKQILEQVTKQLNCPKEKIADSYLPMNRRPN
jgi:hypothetical protein